MATAPGQQSRFGKGSAGRLTSSKGLDEHAEDAEDGKLSDEQMSDGKQATGGEMLDFLAHKKNADYRGYALEGEESKS